MLIIDHDEDGTVGVVLTHGLQNELVVMGSHRLATIQCSYNKIDRFLHRLAVDVHTHVKFQLHACTHVWVCVKTAHMCICM